MIGERAAGDRWEYLASPFKGPQRSIPERILEHSTGNNPHGIGRVPPAWQPGLRFTKGWTNYTHRKTDALLASAAGYRVSFAPMKGPSLFSLDAP